MVATSAFLYLSPKLPDKHSYTNIRLENPLKVYSADNQLLAEFGSRRSNPVPFAAIPPQIVNALIASEDKRFYEHRGVDFVGLLRSVVGIATGKDWGGGSTITMQVTKNFFFEGESAISRKPKEILLAIKMEKELSKQEILQLYLNRTFFGISAYGISAAAKQYYDKDIAQLTLAETATLIGIMPSPNMFNPLKSPERALQERSRVLRRMLDQDMITETQYQEALNSPETARRYGRQPELEAPYVAEMARQEMVNRYGELALTDGYEVYTTVVSKMQVAANKALKAGLERYDHSHGYRGAENHYNGSRSSLLEILAKTPPVGDQHPAFVTKVEEQSLTVLLADGHQTVLNWDGIKWAKPYINSSAWGSSPHLAKEVVSVGDLIRVTHDATGKWVLGQVPALNGSLVSLNPHNGAILALVGGYDFNTSSFNRVTQAKRQPGSNFKPFLYTSALDNGYTAATLINDAPLARSDYRPENFGGDFLGPIRLKYALTQSKNLVSLRLYEALGQDYVLPYISRFGFKEKEFPRDDITIAIGSHAVLPLEIATGYTVFANGGYKVSPYLIEKVANFNDGEVFHAHPATVCPSCASAAQGTTAASAATPPSSEASANPPAPRVLDERTAYIMNSILKAVTTEGSARAVDRSFERTDLAGKTGTTNGPLDLWFSGFNGDVEATVYVGFDQPGNLGDNEQASNVPLPIWIDYMKVVLEGRPENSMKQPDGIATVRINSKTGLRTNPGDPDAIFEVFKAEALPPYADNTDAATTGRTKSTKEEPLF
ncbi:MAG TPA: PBP1A family penicillin-binding protein [Candidatus Acidoferrum sp.]|nr:PBP1A family penicillin-binding protein [Candidatus Acidoferrum sp.]